MVRVLQYRTQYDDPSAPFKVMRWTDWQDVPVVKEVRTPA